MSSNGNTVPEGYWFCYQLNCQQPNKVDIAPEKCSTCGHTRDYSCKEAGDPRSSPIARYNEATFDDSSVVGIMGSTPSITQHHYAIGQYPPDETIVHFPHARYYSYSCLYNTLPAGAPAAGSWMCDCGASNSNLTPDFCPICGRKR
ncbi:hypothetical protein K504DRAFT_486343 [Pleomassaria siparia CBS 279.74]|uniref:RanBP2-type domain-containing protein n=1 Tax=Pleomassaria siparia CBS 279.74 TaxID=1314801 RepID=A0A6G1KP54_9PLEO|nr:hypothetical protein K504DRAFT_486343 [Pleomassaria siparia CBS 279.74]